MCTEYKSCYAFWVNAAFVSPEGSEAAGDVSTEHWPGERPAHHMTHSRRHLPALKEHPGLFQPAVCPLHLAVHSSLLL